MPRLLFVASCLLLLLAGCDNVGRAFDPRVDPNGPEPTPGESAIQIVRAGGDARDGRPKVKTIVPKDGGWPLTVPIAIEFNESVNEASIMPTTPTGTDGRIALRVQGTTQILPCLYDFLAGGKLLIMRPVTALSNEQNPTYEVVLFPNARDVDGVRFQVSSEAGEQILTSFQVNQDPSFTDGRILLTCPRDNKTDAARESNYIVVFDRPANVASINSTSNFIVRQSGVPVSGDIDVALSVIGQPDARAVRFTPDTTLAAGARYELVVDDTITFGAAGTLEFSGGVPFAVFDTIGPQAPTAVHVGNPSTGFPDKINRQNIAATVLHVTTPADAAAGDLVVARIYGLDADTNTIGDFGFVESSTALPMAGTQTVVVDFSNKLGNATAGRFEDGSVTFAVQIRRGSHQSGFMQNDPDDEPVFDVTAPTLTTVGPPGSGNDVFTDLEHLAFTGTASEELGGATLTDGVNPAANMFASSGNGYFVITPVALGRLLLPRGYTLTITDLAGNMAGAPIAGNIVQRGCVTGTLAGTLTVEAYDHATLQPLAGATVLVDPGTPTLPATGQLAAVTNSAGIATFSGLVTTSHTVTIVAAGYDLVTFVGTPAARVSLPLRPQSSPTATFRGTAVFQATVGTTLQVGNSAIDDPRLLGIATTSANPMDIPATAITPNRPQLVTAFGGSFEPTITPTFAYHGYQLFGPTLMSVEPPLQPAAPGGSSEATLVLIPSTGTTANLAGPISKDFALAAGLDTANLLGSRPIVRVTSSVPGFGGQVLGGVGVATLTTGAAYSIDATFGVPLVTGLAAFGPSFWLVSEARDTGGRVSRHRALLITLLGTVIDVTNAPGIPVITTPAGPFTGSPLVTFADVLNAAPVPGGIAIAEVTATDAAGRRWTVMQMDGNGTGGTVSTQFPDLATAAVTGLAAGAWTLQLEARVLLSLTSSTSSDFVLTERRRQEASYARSATESFIIQ